jgi:hypothetical protein
MSKKDFIDTLYKKRSTFADSDQAEIVANLLDTVSNDLYSDSQRFIFELIQNADDAAETEFNEIHFDFYPNHLIVSHNGKPFDEKDILSITHAGKGTKSADLTKTGYKGIGFKSVFGKSNRVTILSDGYNFRFDKKFIQMAFKGNKMPWQIIPIWTAPGDLEKNINGGSLENKFKVSTIIELANSSNLKKELYELLSKGKILLFLRKTSKIKIYSKGVLENQIEKQLQKSETSYTEVKLLQDEKELSNWIVKIFDTIPIKNETQIALKKDDKTPDKLKEAKFTEISFAAKIENGKLKEISGEESLIFAYLPTKITDFGFPFLVNSSFLTNASREGVHEDRIWNQWLFRLIGAKIFDWLGLLAQSKYKFQILNLLPIKFFSTINDLKLTFNNAFEIQVRNKPFIPNKLSQLKKAPEILIDSTDLSEQDFIPTDAIIEFINKHAGKAYSEESFVHPGLEFKHKLKSLGAYTFDLENLEEFFVDEIFKTSHQPSQNFSLIKYFYEKAKNSGNKELNEKLKTIPFIYAKGKKLKSPQTLCFPSIRFETESGESVSVIHSEVYPKIEKEPKVKSWLELLGVKEPSDIAYIENELIGNIETCITHENYKQVTRYLFNQYKKNLLTEWHLECLGDFKLFTIKKEFVEAKNCYLSDFYEPILKLEKILDDGKFVSREYKGSGDLLSEWKTFFLKLGVSENIKPVRIERKDIGTLVHKYGVDIQYFNDYIEVPYYNYSYGCYSITILPLMDKFHKHKVSKLFWKSIFINDTELYRITEATRGFWGFGEMAGQRQGDKIQSYFEWTIKNKECIPATNKKVLKSIDTLINHNDIKELTGHYLPVLDCEIIPDEEFQKLLNFRTKLEIEDFLKILEAIGIDTENDEELKNINKKRLGLIYNKLTSLIPNLSAKKKNIISEWANSHKLLCDNGSFENANELKWVKIEGFTNTSGHLKLLFIPENCETNTDDFEKLLQLFGVQIIDSFIPDIKNKVPNATLKIQLQVILPFFTALLERKQYLDYSVEFKRIATIIDNTEFYSASEIVLSFKNQDETILGPSLNAFLKGSELSFKEKWTNPITLYALIPELLKLFKLSGLTEELKLLLQLDESEIEQWFIEQGYELKRIPERTVHSKAVAKVKFFKTEDDIEPSYDLVDNTDEKSRITINQDAKESILEALKNQGFKVPARLKINFTIIKGIKNPSGLPVKIVVKSGKAGKLYFNPSEWLALTEPDTQLFVVSRGNIVRNVTLGDLIAINDTFHMRFNTMEFAVDTNLKAFANFFRYLPYTHFIFETPESTTDYLQQFGLSERNPSSKELSSDDKNLLH